MDDTVLDDVVEILDRYVSFPSVEARDAVALWAAHTHVIDHLSVTPRLAVLSNEPGSGKSTVMHLLKYLCKNSVYAQHLTGPVLLRIVTQKKPTILYDEIDAIFGVSGASTRNEAQRGMINAGYTRGTLNYRATGTDGIIEESQFAPVAMAGLGTLPPTLLDRSIVVRMVARPSDGPDIIDFDPAVSGDIVESYGKQLARWARVAGRRVSTANPIVPGTNRERQIWLPLFKVAEIVGGDWPARAVKAHRELTKQEDKPLSLPLQLLTDIHAVWPNEASFVPSMELLEALKTWDELWTMATPQSIADILRQYGVSPKTVRRDDEPSVKAYTKADLEPVWERYLQ